MKEWRLDQIESYQLKTFMLRPTAVEIFFYSRKSVFLSFYGKSETVFNKFLQFLNKFRKIEINEKIALPLMVSEPLKYQDKFILTQKWVNREISNF